MKSTSIAVIGAGAIGGVIAARLAAAGQRVTLCSRTPIDRLIVGPGGAQVEAAVDIISEPAAATPVDWVFLATKAQETAGAADWMKHLCTAETTIVVLQNGIDHEDRLRPFSNGASVLPAIVYIGAERTAPGRILEHGGGRLVVPGGKAADRLAALFGPDSIKVEVSEDFLSTSWIKLLGNIFANPITALTLRRADVFRNEKVFSLARALVAEAITVGSAAGAIFPENQLDLTVNGARDLPADSGSSMLYDRLAGRPLEHDYLTGAVVRAADRLGVDAPLNRAMLALLSALSEGLAGKAG